MISTAPRSPPRVGAATSARIELVAADGAVTVLKAKTALKAGEIIDASALSRKALRAFLAAQIEAAKQDQGVLFSAAPQRPQ